MLGLMQDWPLTVDRVIDHAATRHGAREIVANGADGALRRTTYAEIRMRARQLSHALTAAGIGIGDRVATLAFNHDRHFEAWYGTMGIGAVCHTLNPRLHSAQLGWIIRHAGDRVVLVDASLLPLLREALSSAQHRVGMVVVFDGTASDAITYDAWLADQSSDAIGSVVWGGFDERGACGLCYTSGTTGDPKGVLYSHRSNYLHGLVAAQPDVLGLSAADVVLPIVPMFHANAWGLAFAAPGVGSKLVLPGSRLDGASLLQLIDGEQVTFAAAVPTVWQNLLQHLVTTGTRPPASLRRIVVGGAACPERLVRAFEDDYGIEVRHAWGMTELSPLGTVNTPDGLDAAGSSTRRDDRLKQGRPPLGVELALRDEQGRPVAEDGRAVGRLMARGHSVAAHYFGADTAILDADGWFDTGDIAAIDARGYLRITDRAKDIIKSGGEWISSVEIETIAAGHPDVALAAVVGIPDPKWDERPALVVELAPDAVFAPDRILACLDGRIPRWWLPERVVAIDAMPLGTTGKVDKVRLRAWLANDVHSDDGSIHSVA